MNLQNLLGQLSMSSNPMSMVLGMLPNQNLKQSFTSLMNSSSDEERAQKLADWCNEKGITKDQLQKMLNNNRF